MIKKIFLGWLTMLVLISPVIAAGEFTYEGTLSDNGDNYWNKSEAEFYTFKLTSGQTLEVSLAGEGDLDLMLYYGLGNIDSLESSISTSSYRGISYGLDSNETISYVAPGDESVTLAVFSGKGVEGEYTYSLTSNIEISSNLGTTIILIVGTIVFAAIILFILKKQGRF